MNRAETLFMLAGIALLPIAVLGLVLPLLPGTPVLIVAAWCFAKASPEWEARLLAHPRLGPPVRAWRETGAIPTGAKLVALPALAVSGGLALASGAPVWGKAAAIAALVLVGVWIARRPAR